MYVAPKNANCDSWMDRQTDGQSEPSPALANGVELGALSFWSNNKDQGHMHICSLKLLLLCYKQHTVGSINIQNIDTTVITEENVNLFTFPKKTLATDSGSSVHSASSGKSTLK